MSSVWRYSVFAILRHNWILSSSFSSFCLPLSSGYYRSAPLLAHNRMLLRSLSGVACTTPNTSNSQPTAYCFAQPQQGTCLIRLKTASFRFLFFFLPFDVRAYLFSAPVTHCYCTIRWIPQMPSPKFLLQFWMRKKHLPSNVPLHDLDHIRDIKLWSTSLQADGYDPA